MTALAYAPSPHIAELELKARAYAATVKSACYWYPTTRFVFVSERPTRIADGHGEWKWDGGEWSSRS